MNAAGVARVRSRIADLVSSSPDSLSQIVLWVVIALVGLLLVWASLARLDIVAVAQGKLVPQTYVKIVQPAEAGIIRRIFVTDGQHVRAGQILVSLDPTVASSDRRSIAAQLNLQSLQIRRIDAELQGRQLDVRPSDDPQLTAQVRLDGDARSRAHRDQIAEEQATLARAKAEADAAKETLIKLERSLPTFEQSAAAYEKLAADKLVGALESRDRRRLAEEASQDIESQRAYFGSLLASVTAQERRISQIRSGYQSALHSERSQALGVLNQLQESLEKQGYREGLLELRAPQNGIVKELATTTVGAVVQPGTVLLSVVPEHEPLLAEVYIRNDDVGFVHAGQSVRIKLSTYPFTKYGMLEGTVKTIGADSTPTASSSSQQGFRGATRDPQSSFKALVSLGSQQLDVNGRRLPIVAGMEVQAEIRQGTRTVLEYLVSPIRRIGDEAGGER